MGVQHPSPTRHLDASVLDRPTTRSALRAQPSALLHSRPVRRQRNKPGLDRALAFLGEHTITAVEAGYGFGKATLAREAVDSFPGPAIRLTALGVTAEALARCETGSLVVIEHAEQLNNEELNQVEVLLTEMSKRTTSRWLILGRTIDPRVRSRADRVVDSGELTFSVTEVEQLLAHRNIDKPAPLASIIIDATLGWPIAVDRLMRTLSEYSDQRRAVAEMTRRAADDVGLTGPIMRNADKQTNRFLEVASRLPWCDDHILALLGLEPSVVKASQLAGAPIEVREHTVRIHPAVAHRLARRPMTDLAGGVAIKIGRHIIDRGDVLEGIDACIELGDHDAAAALVAELAPHHRMAVDIDGLNARLLIIDHAIDDHPRALLFQALVHFDALRLDSAAQLLQRAEAAARRLDGKTEDERQTLGEVLVEQAFWSYATGDTATAHSYLAEAEAAADPLAPATRTRLIEVQAGLRCRQGDQESLEIAAEQLGSVIEFCRGQGDIARVASALMRLAIHVFEPLGRRVDAMRVLDDALALPTLSVRDRARVQVFRARVLPPTGAFDEAVAAAEDGLQLAEFSDYDWATAMGHWALASIASFRSDGATTTTHLQLAALTMGELIKHGTGILFCAEAAEALARCGDEEQAHEWLDRIANDSELASDNQVAARFARASVEARFGNQSAADAELALLFDDGEPGHQWRVELLRALCAHRSGEDEEAAQRTASALHMAAELGVPEAPRHTEATVFAQLEVNAGAAAPLEVTTNARLSLFGPFAVCIGDELVRPVGHAATLLKLLAVGRGSIKIDQAIDVLWPEADSSTGKRRLRNVISRCHKALGRSAIERVGDSLLLEDDFSTDYGRAIELADQALRVEPGSTAAAHSARRAMPSVELLLTDDRYEDWAEDVRAQYAELREQVFALG